MIRFDDQPPMSPAADAWAESVLIKSINIKIKKFPIFLNTADKDKEFIPAKTNNIKIFFYSIFMGGAWEFGYPEWMLFTYDILKITI
ncbi:MAG: hypothetical protein CM1200mP33_6620 [Chloroflexota bacterium]|nr:MAG: hypothetical protein CM1200mP33_6620 [Chloroflexota bacterium]